MKKDFSRTAVKVIQKTETTVLVEYKKDDLSERKIIPRSELGDGQVLDSVLDSGIPYGYPWEEISLSFDSFKFAEEMHQVGLWTVEDAMKNPQGLWSALNATYGDQISQVLQVARNELKGVHNGR